MTAVTYSDLVRAAGDSSLSTIRRVSEALGCTDAPITPFDAYRIIMVELLYGMGFSRSVGCELLEEFSSEILFISRSPEHEAWAVFVEPISGTPFRIAATSRSHLAAMLSGIPMSLVIPLHRLWEDAAVRLRKAQRAARAQGDAA